jgi:hypothetical protein
MNEGEELAVFDSKGTLVAVAMLGTDRLLQPTKVLA